MTKDRYVSPLAQLEALDALIKSGRSGVPLPKSQRDFVCDRAAVVRDRVASHMARMEERGSRFSRSEIASLYNSEKAR